MALLVISGLVMGGLAMGGLAYVVLGPDFEIDGDTIVGNDLPFPGGEDWVGVILGGEPDWDTGPAILIKDVHSKAPDGPDPSIFSPSGKFEVPENWSIKAGQNPGQNELTNIYVYAYVPTDPAEDVWLMMGMERTKKTGTFDLDFEINQEPWVFTLPHVGGPDRTENDVVVAFELKGNPTDPLTDLEVIILIYGTPVTQCFTTYGPGGKIVAVDDGNTTCPLYGESGFYYRFRGTAAALGDFGSATMNSVAFDAPPWDSQDSHGDLRNTVGPFEFAEAAINLSYLGLEIGCPGLGTVHAKSRSSLEPSSDLKDLAGPKSLAIECMLFGNKFHDLNANGTWDGGEEPLELWPINLYAGGTFIDTTSTNETGYYEFTALEDGLYWVEEVCPASWNQSYPTPTNGCGSGVHTGIQIDIGNQTQGPYDFGNWQLATKGGHKYEDMDADGNIAEDTDHPLAEWWIYLDGTDGTGHPVSLSTQTNATGYYKFEVPPGTYIVTEGHPAGWTCSYPNPCYYDPVVLTSAEVDTNNDFGNWYPGTKSGNKYEDMNANGNITEDTGEPLDGWEIRAYADSDGSGVLSGPEYGDGNVTWDTTDGAGAYTMTLDPGDYIICEVLKAGWTQSAPSNSICQVTASDLGPGGHAITVTSRATLTGNDFGNWYPGTKSGNKYEDMNANGNITEDTGKPLIGWEIRAYADGDGSGVLSALEAASFEANDTTDGAGAYTLTLDPGDYIICEVLKAGWTQSAPSNSICDAGADLGPGGHAITVTSRLTLTDNDFGNWYPGTKSGTKFEDMNADGAWDPDGVDNNTPTADDETGLSGWEIRAYADSDGSGVLSALEAASFEANDTTDGAGAYTLTLDPGDYIICEVLKDNWFQSYPSNSICAAGADLGDAGYAITVTSRLTLIDNDFGNYQQADLEVTKTGTITYTANVTNNGPSVAVNVDLDDDLPGNLTWTESPDKAECTITGNHLHCDIATLASGASFLVTVEATIEDDCGDPSLGNTASADSDIYDPDLTNNSDDADICPLP